MNRKTRICIGVSLMIVLIGGIYLYANFDPEDYWFFPKCLFFLLTGYKCPGCGSQRALYHLFHGHIATAFTHNPLMLLIIPYVFSGIYFEYFADKANPRTANIHKLLFGKWAVCVVVGVILVFTFCRNLSFPE